MLGTLLPSPFHLLQNTINIACDIYLSRVVAIRITLNKTNDLTNYQKHQTNYSFLHTDHASL